MRLIYDIHDYFQREEQEKRAREEAERLERERLERAKREEEERLERKKVSLQEFSRDVRQPSGFLTRSDTNRPAQLQKMARDLKIWI